MLKLPFQQQMSKVKICRYLDMQAKNNEKYETQDNDKKKCIIPGRKKNMTKDHTTMLLDHFVAGC